MDATRSRATVLVAGALAVGLAAGPAAAKPGDTGGAGPERIHDQYTEPFPCWLGEPPTEQSPRDPDFVLTLSVDVQVTTSFRPTGHNPAPVLHDRVHGTETWTTPDGQHTVTHVFNANFRDRPVVQGDELLITSQGAGNDTFFLDGERIGRNPGMNRVEFRILHGGTLDDRDDDEFVEGSFRVVKPSTGLNELTDFDPCRLLAPYVP